jgi:hypothetical protein
MGEPKQPPPPSTTAAPYVADPFGPHPTPSYGTPAMLSDVKAEERRTDRVVADVVAVADSMAKDRAWKAGWAAGIGGVCAAVAVSFVVWFRAEAMAQEKVDAGVALVNAQTDAKIAGMKSDIDTLKFVVGEQSKKLDTQGSDIKEVLDLVRKQKGK